MKTVGLRTKNKAYSRSRYGWLQKRLGGLVGEFLFRVKAIIRYRDYVKAIFPII
jgi:hypothetical protein